MKKIILTIGLLLGLAGITQPILAVQAQTKMMPAAKCSTAAINLEKAMRSLWEDHVIYTQFYIISSLADLPGADVIAQRLLRNQDDIGNAIKPYYGKAAGDKLTSLLREHILIAADVVKAAKTNDAEGLKAVSQKWQDNANTIATFLSSANPNWSKSKLQQMLTVHLGLTTASVTARLQKDWKKDIDAFDEGEVHMLNFADYLSNGIIKQFPSKFTH